MAAKKAREKAIQKQKEENEAREQHERQLVSKKAREEAIQEQQEQEEHERKRQLAEEKAREEAIQKRQEQEERRRLEIEAAKWKRQEEQTDRKQKEDVAATEAAAKLQLQQQKDEEDAATKQRKKLEQLEKMYSNKFKTRAALDRELKQLQELVKAAEGLCFNPEVNSKGVAAMVEYHTLVPLCDSPKFLSVAELDSKDIYHRDIKPENICMHEGWEQMPHMVLIDFGISKQVPTNVASSTMTSNPGTEMFVVPEYIDKKRHHFDEKSEVFAAGAVMMCLISGSYSLLALGQATDCSSQVLLDSRDNTSGEWPDDVANSFSVIISRCNNADPDKRPTVKNLLVELKELHSLLGNLDCLTPDPIKPLGPTTVCRERQGFPRVASSILVPGVVFLDAVESLALVLILYVLRVPVWSLWFGHKWDAVHPSV